MRRVSRNGTANVRGDVAGVEMSNRLVSTCKYWWARQVPSGDLTRRGAGASITPWTGCEVCNLVEVEGWSTFTESTSIPSFQSCSRAWLHNRSMTATGKLELVIPSPSAPRSRSTHTQRRSKAHLIIYADWALSPGGLKRKPDDSSRHAAPACGNDVPLASLDLGPLVLAHRVDEDLLELAR